MGNIIQTSSPFLREFTHQDFTVSTTAQTALPSVNVGEKRIITIIQNQSATATVTVVLSGSGTSGVILQPATFFSLDNYNGVVRLIASAAGTPVHIATSQV